MKKLPILFLIAGFSLSAALPLKAQSTDSLKKNNERRNIIKFNVSSFFVYKLALLLEYERVVSKNQSFSIQAGFVSLAFINTDSIQVLDFKKNSGYSITGDYRFYLLKENKDGPPHGVYIGPYAGYMHVLNEINMARVNTPNTLTTQIDIMSIGGELGYQFLLGKRWTLDFVLLGPSLSYYKAKMNLEFPVDTSQGGAIYQQALASLANRFPLVNGLVNDQSATFHGKLDAWNAGFRYSMHIGFRF